MRTPGGKPGATQSLTQRLTITSRLVFDKPKPCLLNFARVGVVCAIFALSFENEGAVNERGKLRAQIEGLLREKALKRRRELLLMWTREARRLAGEFSRTGQWRYFRALLRHVIGRQKRLNGDLA